MSKVVRLSDQTATLLDRYRKIEEEDCKKKDIKLQFHIKDDLLLQTALMWAIDIMENS